MNLPTNAVLPSGSDVFCEVLVKNATDKKRTDWVYSSVPFPKGLVNSRDELNFYSNRTGVCDWEMIKFHPDGSVAIGGLYHAEAFEAGEEKKVQVYKLPVRKTPWGFQPGPTIGAWAGSPNFQSDVFLKLKFKDDANFYFAFLEMTWPNGKITDQNQARPCVRTRNHFRASKFGQGIIVHPASFTAHLHLASFVNWCDVAFTIGNDQREIAIPGGMTFDSIEIFRTKGFQYEIKEPKKLGISDWKEFGPWEKASFDLTEGNTLADGQTITIRGRISIQDQSNQDFYDSAMLGLRDPLIGIAPIEVWNASGAPGMHGVVPQARFTDPRSAREVLETETPRIPNRVGWYWRDYGFIDVSPSNTGEQPDFSGGMSYFALQAIQSQSSAPILNAWGAIDQECQRPCFLWEQRNGIEDRLSCVNYQRAAFWQDKPHYDPNWNVTEYPELNTRARFDGGNSNHWAGQENQHRSENALRCLLELTGDPIIRDICRYRLSLAYLAYLGHPGYKNYIDAERATRTMKEATQYVLLFHDTPEAKLTKQAIIDKNRNCYLPAVQANRAKYNLAGLNFGDACDDHFKNIFQACGKYESNEIVVPMWNTAFTMEFEALFHRLGWDTATSEKMILAYLDSYPAHFYEDKPCDYYLATDYSQRSGIGGITYTWGTGWLIASKLFPWHPNAIKIQANLLPNMTFNAPVQTFWAKADVWKPE